MTSVRQTGSRAECFPGTARQKNITKDRRRGETGIRRVFALS